MKDHAYKPELQAFRGLAALLVLVHHCFRYFRTDWLRHVGGEVVLNAHAAVVAFYVLSGFVLSIALSGSAASGVTYATFLVRRVFRIYPALWAALLIAWAYVIILKGVPIPHDVVDRSWVEFRNGSPTPLRLAATFLAVSDALPMPIWSIFAEIAAAPLVPLLYWSAKRSPATFWTATFVLAVLSFAVGQHTRMNVGVYLVDFALGVAAFVWGGRLVAWIDSKKAVMPAALIALSTLLFGRLAGGWSFETDYHSPAASLTEAIAAALLICLIANRPAGFGVLASKIAVRLGDLSYSLYLVHLPILALMAGFLGDVLGLPPLDGSSPVLATFALLLGTLAVSIPLSAVLFAYIERPANLRGRHAASWLGRKLHARSVSAKE